MSTYKKGDKVRVTGPTNNGREWFLPLGDVALVEEDEKYGHVYINSIKYPKKYRPYWQYPVASVEPVS
jgi:hypothetical protein